MKGIATMLFGVAMILLAICSTLLFFAGGYTIFVVLLGIFAFIGFFAVVCGLLQVYELRKGKNSAESLSGVPAEQSDKKDENK